MIMTAGKFNMVKETARQILVTNFKMRDVCVKMVPKNLSEDQKLARREVCFEILENIDDDDDATF
jgi:hypothetical protein